MITERTLKRWRKEALVYTPYKGDEGPMLELSKENSELRERILRMTAELLDQHLMRKE